jgi:hypothetical protein
MLIAIIVVVAVVGLGGALMALKYWATAPALEEPEVQMVYEGGGMYSETSAEYAGADTAGRDGISEISESGGPVDRTLPEPEGADERGPPR